jgi:hypothetical protein
MSHSCASRNKVDTVNPSPPQNFRPRDGPLLLHKLKSRVDLVVVCWQRLGAGPMIIFRKWTRLAVASLVIIFRKWTWGSDFFDWSQHMITSSGSNYLLPLLFYLTLPLNSKKENCRAVFANSCPVICLFVIAWT